MAAELQAVLLSEKPLAEAHARAVEVFYRTILVACNLGGLFVTEEHRAKKQKAEEMMRDALRRLREIPIPWREIYGMSDSLKAEIRPIWLKWVEFYHLEVDPVDCLQSANQDYSKRKNSESRKAERRHQELDIHVP